MKFLMVVTEVDQDSQIVTLDNVNDWEPPAQMKWFYEEVEKVTDKRGDVFEITLKQIGKAL